MIRSVRSMAVFTVVLLMSSYLVAGVDALVIYDDHNEYGRDLISFSDGENVTSACQLEDSAVYSSGAYYFLLGCFQKSIYKSFDGISWVNISWIPSADRLIKIVTFGATTFAISSSYGAAPTKVGQLFRSPDRGSTWIKTLDSTGDQFYDMAKGPDGYIYIGEYDIDYIGAHDVYMSADDGLTWAKCFDASAVVGSVEGSEVRHTHDIMVDSSNTIWVCTGDADSMRTVYKSNDHGATWTVASDDFQGHDGFISSCEVGGWIYFGADTMGRGVWRTPVGDGTYWENWNPGPKANYLTYNQYSHVWDMFTYGGVIYKLDCGVGLHSAVMASVVGQPSWINLFSPPDYEEYVQSTGAVFEHGSEKFFFIHRGTGYTYKVQVKDWKAVYHALWGFPAGKTSALIELKENETTYASFMQSPLYNAQIRFVGWNDSNILAGSGTGRGKWDMNPTFEAHNYNWYVGTMDPAKCYWSKESAHSGQYSLQLNLSAEDREFWSSGWVYTTESKNLIPGHNYTLSYWIKANRTGVDNCFWGAYIKMQTWSGWFCTYIYNCYYLTDSWVRHSFAFRAPENFTADKTCLIFKLQNSGGRPVKAYIDDIQLNEGCVPTAFRNGAIKTTVNPSVLLNGVTYSYAGSLNNGSVSPWINVGNLCWANMTANDQNFKVEIRSQRPSTISSHESIIEKNGSDFKPVSLGGEAQVNVTGYLPSGARMERMPGICYRISGAKANMTDLAISATGQAELWFNDSWTTDVMSLVVRGSAAVMDLNISLGGLKPGDLYRILVDGIDTDLIAVGASFSLAFTYSGPWGVHDVALVLTGYADHPSISITGNSDFAAQALAEGWLGDGTEADPYIIEGWSITTTGPTHPISISNTNAFFIIQHCRLQGETDAAVELMNVANATVLDNTLRCAQSVGLRIYQSNNISISWNNIAYTEGGMAIEYSTFVDAENNSCISTGGFGINLYYASNILMANNLLKSSSFGVMIRYSSDNEIWNNSFLQNEMAGINITGLLSSGNVIWNNTFYENNGSTTTFDPAHIQAADFGFGNLWYVAGFGNTWGDWLSPDLNINLIVDYPYSIYGSANSKDYYPQTPPDTTPPLITITSPSGNPPYTTRNATIDLAGTAYDANGISSMSWKSMTTGASGIPIGITSWSISAVALRVGDNRIFINATDLTGNKRSEEISVYRDNNTPICTISFPTNESTYFTNCDRIKLMGTATDDVCVYSVIWTNSRGGSGTANMSIQSGGAFVSWQSQGNITVYTGTNVITVKAYDTAVNIGTDVLTVVLDTTPPTCVIISPTNSSQYKTGNATIDINGTASDDSGILNVTWMNIWTGAYGTANGTTSWSISRISLLPGLNPIYINATDLAGNKKTVNIGIIYTPPPELLANGSAYPTSGNPPLTVLFSSNPIGGESPYTYFWTFGDGSNSTKKNPSHTYNKTGKYTVTLMVKDNASHTVRWSTVITVTDSGAELFGWITLLAAIAAIGILTIIAIPAVLRIRRKAKGGPEEPPIDRTDDRGTEPEQEKADNPTEKSK